MFAVVASKVSLWPRQSSNVNRDFVRLESSLRKLEVVDAKLWSIASISRAILTESVICGGEAGTSPCDCHSELFTLKANLHTVPRVVLNFDLISPVVRIVVLHECDEPVRPTLASRRRRWEQSNDVATVCPEQQLHIGSPSLHACSSEGECKCVVTPRFFEWQESKAPVRTRLFRHCLGHVCGPSVVLEHMLVSTCSLVNGGPARATTTRNEVAVFSPPTAAKIFVALKSAEITCPCTSFFTTLGTALFGKTTSSSWAGTWCR